MSEHEGEQTDTGKFEEQASTSATTYETKSHFEAEECMNDEKEEEEEVEEEESEFDANQMASDIIYDILRTSIGSDTKDEDQLYEKLNENDQLTAFIEDTLGALADDIEMGERTYIPHNEIYFWMTYFFLQFCGFRIFLANIDEIIKNNQSVNEVAAIIVELVDNVAENAAYLHSDSDLPEHIAKNMIWQMLNSRAMKRRYDSPNVAQWQAEDILDELIERVVSRPDAPPAEPVREQEDQEEETAKGSISEKMEEPQVCREYAGIFKVAEFFVASLIEESAGIANRTSHRKPSDTVEIEDADDQDDLFITPAILSKVSSRFRPGTYIKIPSIETFNIKLGKKTLLQLIENWNHHSFLEEWSYAVKFIMGQSDACSDFYIYEAKFGLPTPLYPVPQATCSVLFTIEVSRVKPPVCSVNITFKIEGSGYVHTQGEYVFQESWLLNVIDAKIRLFSRIQF